MNAGSPPDPTSSALDKKFVVDKCDAWDATVRLMYNACMDKAGKFDMLAGLSSMTCIVLNVLIVGKSTLSLPHISVSIFVAVNSVIKALQMQFVFAATASECHDAKGGLRSVLVNIENVMIEGKYGNCTRAMLENLRKEVEQGITAAPGYIDINPPKLSVKSEKYDQGLFSFFSSKEAQIYPDSVVPAQTTQIERPAPLVLGTSPVRHNEPLDVAVFIDPSLAIHERSPDVEAANVSRLVQEEVQHAMAPPPGAQASAIPPPPSGPPPFSHHLAADLPIESDGKVAPLTTDQGVKDAIEDSVQQLAASVTVQRKTIDGLAETLDVAVKISRYWLCVNSTMSFLMSTIELVLNSVIMIASSEIFQDEFQSAGKSIVGICASFNAVLKGLEMKLQFEVKAATVHAAYRKFKSLQQRVDMAKLDVDVRRTAMDPRDFQDLKDAFQQLVNIHAHWIPVAQRKKHDYDV